MTPNEVVKVHDAVECEGFEYTFTSYSDFKDIEDPEFHRLRLAYVNAHKELKEFLAIED